ncbi:uncharacterized protein METZ01_LOCUS387012, partial [marine metagenome]
PPRPGRAEGLQPAAGPTVGRPGLL